MSSEPILQQRKRWDLPSSFGALLSFATLLILLALASAYIQQPDEGFILDSETGEVIFVNEPCDPAEDGPSCLAKGDLVLEVAGVTFESYRGDRTLPFYEPFKDQEEVEIVFLRNGVEHTILLQAAASSRSFFSKLAAIFFPFLFWGMGTIAVIFLRPRDERWLLLILLQFDTALWVSSGFVGYTQVAFSAVLFDIVIWLFLPLSIHLHLILPDAPFRRLHRWILPPLYASAVLLMILDQLGWVARSGKLISTLLAMLVSLGLLGLRRWAPGEISEGTRIANQVMFFGVTIGLGPVIILTLFYLIDLSAALSSSFMTLVVTVFLLASPIWPLTYIYAIYRHDLGTFEFRANRLLGTYGFFALYITSYIIVYSFFLRFWLAWEVEEYFYGLCLSMVFVTLTPVLLSRFQKLVDRHVFGIKYRPNQVVSLFAERIPTSFNLEVLQGVIVDEILPTLQVRQSALYELDDGEVRAIYEQGVPREGQEVQSSEVRALLEHAGAYISYPAKRNHRFSWVRLVIPLAIQDEIIGAWLLGRRDPDDYYPRSDVALLTNLANQIAPVIENVRLVEKAQEEVAENKKLQQQLLHSQKMEAIGRLSAGVAHDFNNILSVIIGYSNLVMIQYREDTQLIQAISSIKEAGERASTLTRQLLAFSRKQVMEVRVSNLNAIVTDLEKMLRRLTGEDIELTTELGVDLPNVRIDPGQMGQVLINLVVNARDAMPEGGRIRIVTKNVWRDGDEPEHDEAPPGQYAVLVVEDSGTGIEADLQGRIFEPYFTTKGHGKGTGLGLSMAYGIINQSRGFIFVDSAVGAGTSFCIYLPAVQADEAQTPSEERKSLKTSGGTETILLVEDEQSVRAVTREILRSSGYEVISARNGLEALEKIDEHPRPIDLLLTDVVMPKMKGPELAQSVLDRFPGIKIIYMSGYNEESILGRRIGEDGSILIQKPFTPQDLSRRVREVLDGRAVSEPATLSSEPAELPPTGSR